MATYLTRRQAVSAAAAALPLTLVTGVTVSGCNGLDVLAPPPPPSQDVELLRGAIAAETLMVGRYRAALLGFAAALGRALEPLLAEHQAHLAQLKSRLVLPPGSAASASAPPSPSPSPSPGVPANPAEAVASLRAAEQAAAAAMLGRLPHAPASLAQLFASISASEATHVPVLAGVGT